MQPSQQKEHCQCTLLQIFWNLQFCCQFHFVTTLCLCSYALRFTTKNPAGSANIMFWLRIHWLVTDTQLEIVPVLFENIECQHLVTATGLTLCVLINFDLTSSPNPQVPTGDHIIVLKEGNTIHIWFYLKEKKLKQLDTVGFNKQIDKIVHSLLSAANVTYLELQWIFTPEAQCMLNWVNISHIVCVHGDEGTC